MSAAIPPPDPEDINLDDDAEHDNITGECLCNECVAKNNEEPKNLIDYCYEGNFDMAKQLIESGANVDSLRKGIIPLYAAIQANSVEIVKLLLEKGADPNGLTYIPNPYSYFAIYVPCWNFPLYHATVGGKDIKIIYLLINHGAYINDVLSILQETQHEHDNSKAIRLIEYAVQTRQKINILKEEHENNNSSLLHRDYLPRDMFNIIIDIIENPDDELLKIREDSNSILTKLWQAMKTIIDY